MFQSDDVWAKSPLQFNVVKTGVRPALMLQSDAVRRTGAWAMSALQSDAVSTGVWATLSLHTGDWRTSASG